MRFILYNSIARFIDAPSTNYPYGRGRRRPGWPDRDCWLFAPISRCRYWQTRCYYLLPGSVSEERAETPSRRWQQGEPRHYRSRDHHLDSGLKVCQVWQPCS